MATFDNDTSKNMTELASDIHAYNSLISCLSSDVRFKPLIPLLVSFPTYLCVAFTILVLHTYNKFVRRIGSINIVNGWLAEDVKNI